MGSITHQPPASSTAHGTYPLQPTSSSRATRSDTFLDMIQGRSITVVVGQYPSSCIYTLPVTLLCVHSLHFRDRIARLNTASLERQSNSKKRKHTPYNDGAEAEAEAEVEVKVKTEKPTENESAKENTTNEVGVITLPDVDPTLFGLFLKFMYKDSYPSNVDAKPPTTHHHPRSSTAIPKPTNSGPTTTAGSRPPSSNVSPNNSKGYIQATPPLSHMPTLMPPPSHMPTIMPPPSHMPTLMPPPPPPQGLSQIECIPPSVHAWLLAQRLGALSFMNHAISHIFSGIGVHFALTPALIDYVWKETSPSPSPSSSSPTNHSTSPVLNPSPLRKLLLDVLVIHWSRFSPSNPNTVVLRSLSVSPNFSTPLKDAWDKLFNEHTELRNDFIYGLQGGVKLMPVNGYFATSALVGQGDMYKGGAAKEQVQSGERAEENAVVVKEEKCDDVEVLKTATV